MRLFATIQHLKHQWSRGLGYQRKVSGLSHPAALGELGLGTGITSRFYSHDFLQLLTLLMTFFQSFLKFGFCELALSWSISLLPRFCFLSAYTFTPRFYIWSYKFYHFCKYLVSILGISENTVISNANDDILLSPLQNCISLCCPISLP